MMKNALLKNIAAMAIVAIVAACGSSPRSNHYVLSAKPGTLSGQDEPALGIGPIAIPEYLNRNALVYNRQGNKLQVASSERWAEPLLRYLERMVGDAATAEELVQESFLRVHGARDRYEPRARFSTFLYRIATNLALNELKRPRRCAPATAHS